MIDVPDEDDLIANETWRDVVAAIAAVDTQMNSDYYLHLERNDTRHRVMDGSGNEYGTQIAEYTIVLVKRDMPPLRDITDLIEED